MFKACFASLLHLTHGKQLRIGAWPADLGFDGKPMLKEHIFGEYHSLVARDHHATFRRGDEEKHGRQTNQPKGHRGNRGRCTTGRGCVVSCVIDSRCLTGDKMPAAAWPADLGAHGKPTIPTWRPTKELGGGGWTAGARMASPKKTKLNGTGTKDMIHERLPSEAWPGYLGFDGKPTGTI